MIWYDGISQVLFPNTSMIRHVLRSFSSSNVKTGCSSTLWLACAHQEHFVNRCQRSLVQFSRNYVVQQGFVASPWKKFPQAPAVATKTYLPQHFLYCFFKPCLSTQKGRRASTARSQAVERTDKLPECVLSRCSKHANRPACRSLWVGSTWVGIEVTL